MTVLMTDARDKLSQSAVLATGDLEDILLADDTLLISMSGHHVEEYMAAVTACGSQYGLQIHWDRSMKCQSATKSQYETHLENPFRLRPQ